MPPTSGEGGAHPHARVDTPGGGGPCPRAWGRLSAPHTQPFGPQLAEIHGVPRGLYDGPVHEVTAPTKPGAGSQARASCPGKISVPPFRNLHQSGFSLSGEWSLGCSVSVPGPRGPCPAPSPGISREVHKEGGWGSQGFTCSRQLEPLLSGSGLWGVDLQGGAEPGSP